MTAGSAGDEKDLHEHSVRRVQQNPGWEMRREHLMRHFPGILGNFAVALAGLTLASIGALAAALGVLTLATVGASAGIGGTRPASAKSELHRPSDYSAAKGKVASNCFTTSSDRLVGAQRVWTPHGVMSLGGQYQRVQTTECR
jgi:hypothetical protein